ncbi:MAG: hypothetical protein U0800_16565 [Isosphaeraceae bacterium]
MVELAEEMVEQTPGFLRVRLPEVEGEYELTCSSSLVQAVGECCEVDFYFRAKHGYWQFVTQDKQGHSFPVKDLRRFVLEGRYEESKPGAMSMAWSARLLRRCLAEWWGVIV